MTGRSLLILVGCTALSATPTAIPAQVRLVATVRPAYSHALDSGSGSMGAWGSLLVVRTRNVSVGPELGFFHLGTVTDSYSYRDPINGTIPLEERRSRSLWFGGGAARYRLPGTVRPALYTEVGVGLYRLSESLLTSVSPPDASGVLNASIQSESRSLHPGVSLGLGACLSSKPARIGVEISVRAHSLLGAGEGLLPLLALSVGLYREYGPGS